MRNPAVVRIAVMVNLLLLVTMLHICNAATYYVDRNHPSAADTNPGTLNQPWQTIQHAAETAIAGDTVLIRYGIYNEHVRPANSGNNSGYIVFSALGTGTPILDGAGVTESQNGIVITQQYIKLIGLEVRNWSGNGIWIEGTAFIEISDCIVHHCSYGIGVSEGTHDFELNRVLMHHFDLYGFDVSPNGVDCYNGTLNDCVAHTGRDPAQNVDGFATGHGNQHHITFNRCEAYNVYDGFGIGENAGNESVHIVVNRCSAHDCWNDGYKLTGRAEMVNCLGYNSTNANLGLYWGTQGGTSIVHSCTFMQSDTYNVWIENSADTLVMHNCILAGSDGLGLSFEQRNSGNYTGDYNIFHNGNSDRMVVIGYEDEFTLGQIESGAWTAFSGQDAHSIAAYATRSIFGDTTGNLYPGNQSLAIDNGTAVGAPSEDYEGLPRPVGRAYDIGAYEYRTGSDVDHSEYRNELSKFVSHFQISPNPSGSMTSIHFEMKRSANVRLTLANSVGKVLRVLEDGFRVSGWHNVMLPGTGLPNGRYFIVLDSEGQRRIQSLVLVR